MVLFLILNSSQLPGDVFRGCEPGGRPLMDSLSQKDLKATVLSSDSVVKIETLQKGRMQFTALQISVALPGHL